MSESKRGLTRQTFVESMILLPALAGISSASSLADSKVSKDSVHYQSTPNGDKQCAGCKSFIAAKDSTSDGTCKLVEGAISPQGYCIAYAAK